MAFQDNHLDLWQPLRELQRRIEILERANPLNNSSIDGGSGLRVASAEGIHVDPGGSISAGAAQISHSYGGIVKAGGTSIGADGGIRNDDGKITLVNRVDPIDGVYMSWGGKRHTMEQVTGWLNTDIGTTAGKVSTLEGKVSTTEGKVSTLEGKASTASSKISTLEGKASTAEGKLSALESKVSVIEGKLGVSG